VRKLASIRKIHEIKPIEGADAIELCVADGWEVVTKKGEYKVGDLAVYLEIDSWVPTELAPFLSKGKEPRVYNGVRGELLRTVKLRRTLSQGLLLPVDYANGEPFISGYFLEDGIGAMVKVKEGDDVTEALGIQKWEPEIPAQLAGLARGSFPSIIPRTDQERIQNLKQETRDRFESATMYEITEKIEGSSATFFLDSDGDFQVCSRNLSLKNTEGNSFWRVAIKFDIEAKMKQYNLQGLAIQGEIIGPGIQGNIYKLNDVDFYVFDVYDTKAGCYLTPETRRDLIFNIGLKNAPIIYKAPLPSPNIESLLPMADGESEINPKTLREGIVLKSMSGTSHSFKIVSNLYLLGEK